MSAPGEDLPLAKCIERALFAPGATRGGIEKLCAEAREHAWFAVCVNGSRVAADERPVKLVLETHLLAREELILAVELALDSGAQFVATSTDWHVPDVKIEDVALLREKAGAEFGIKAAGNIRDAQTAQALINAGATRIGTTSGFRD
jgi:deoxyribose-phosphate aldolase